MTRILRGGRPFLANLPSADPSRATRDLLRKSTEKFFLPFVQPRRSCPDLSAYHFKENLSNVLVPAIIDKSSKLNPKPGLPSPPPGNSNAVNGVGDSNNGAGSSSVQQQQQPPPNAFLGAAQLNGEVGTSRLFEDLFHVVLSGFDFVHVNVENKDGCSVMSCLQDPCHFRGFVVLAHTRPFLGWEPSYIHMSKDAFSTELNPNCAHDTTGERSHSRFQLHTHDVLPFVKETADAVLVPMTFKLPFSTHAEGAFTEGHSKFLLTHLNLRMRLVDALCVNPDERDTLGVARNRLDTPPPAVVRALKDKKTVQLFAGLRRLGVRPELITAETLLAATEQKAEWTEALGVV